MRGAQALSCGKKPAAQRAILAEIHSPPVNITEFLENTSYEKDKGFCIKRFDDKGCNTCTFMGFCKEKACPAPQPEQANVCVKYLSVPDFLKAYGVLQEQ